MNPVVVGGIVFGCTLGGALVGNWIRTILPQHHLSNDSKDTVHLGIGLVATMTALVLGLVTASAKSNFDAMDAAVRHTAADLLTLDRLLARYGPETGELRGALRDAVESRVDEIWPSSSSRRAQPGPTSQRGVESIADAIRNLAPRDDSQRALQTRALDLAEALLQVRWFKETGGASVPLPFLAVLLFWLTVTFASFGLFAPRNATVLAVLVVCALSVGSAVFLILELDGPLTGLLKVSESPLRFALSHLDH